MALVYLKTRIREESIEFTSLQDFLKYYERNDELSPSLATQIVMVFFRRVIFELYKGWSFKTPIGTFFIKKNFVKVNNNYISQAGTRKLRKETGDETAICYRTNDSFFSLAWAYAKIHTSLQNFSFKASWGNERAIGKNEKLIKLYVKHVV